MSAPFRIQSLLPALALLFSLAPARAQQSKPANAGPSVPNAPSATRIIPPEPTGRQRWNQYVRDTYTTPPIYFAALGSAIGDQITNTPKPWGRTGEGYAKRVGTNYATFAIQTSVYAGGSALLHNQSRYVPCQCKGAWHRAGYALEMTFFTYHDGNKVLDVPQFAAAYSSGIIPVLWFPRGYSVSAQGIQRGTAQMGWVGGVREMQEFAPELKHFFRKLKP